MNNKAQHGFTLIELMTATAIAGVLAATAYPSFLGPVFKARRVDGITALLQLQMRQENWRAGHRSYASADELNAGAPSPMRYYQLSVVDASANGFTALATASGIQAGDTACRFLRLTVDAGNTHYTSGADANTNNASADNKRCWNL